MANSRYFKNKVGCSLRFIESKMNNKAYVSWSGGKDSNVVLHLCRCINPDVKVMHMESGYSLPDNFKYIFDVVKKYNINFEELKAEIDYLELCSEFGLPHLRDKKTQQKVVKQIKKNPATEWALKNNYKTMFWGIRSEESNDRKALAKFKGRCFIDKNGIEKVSPILNWTVKEIWAYHLENKIPVNGIYIKENCGESCETIRNTGWLSTDGENRGRLEWLRKNYPEQYRKVRELL